MTKCQLPIEILELIISYIPDSDNSFALPPSHTVTKTLYSCLFVSKATVASSVEQLYSRCLYIDSARRLQALLRSYNNNTPLYGRKTDPERFRRMASTAMYLAPFSADSIDEPLVVDGLSKLFGVLSVYLRRLVIDMPLRSYYPNEVGSPNLRLVLRNAFLSLKILEEFVSIRDELSLSTQVPRDYSIELPVWSTWNHLRKLSLYNLDTSDEMIEIMKQMPSLRSLVLTRPDLPEEAFEYLDSWRAPFHIAVVNTWRDHITKDRRALNSSLTQPFGTVATKRRLPRATRTNQDGENLTRDIVCVDGQNPVKDHGGGHRLGILQYHGNNWAAYDLRNTYNDIRVCQQWVKQNALEGILWPV